MHQALPLQMSYKGREVGQCVKRLLISIAVPNMTYDIIYEVNLYILFLRRENVPFDALTSHPIQFQHRLQCGQIDPIER